jgi:hypothetical protein
VPMDRRHPDASLRVRVKRVKPVAQFSATIIPEEPKILRTGWKLSMNHDKWDARLIFPR